MIAWVESSCPSDCGKVWGDVGYYHRIQRPPKQSHNRLGSDSRPRPSLIFKVGKSPQLHNFFFGGGGVGVGEGPWSLASVGLVSFKYPHINNGETFCLHCLGAQAQEVFQVASSVFKSELLCVSLPFL